ncbi:MAG: tyrosine-type recombinase/integrase, partial [Solirubrobacteraceae bacterium]
MLALARRCRRAGPPETLTDTDVPGAVQQALEAWVKVHTPLARGVALLDEQPLFVRLGRTDTSSRFPCPRSPCTGSCAAAAAAGGVPERLCHPHALRAYRATRCLEAGVSVHEVSARLGHVDLRTTARDAVTRPERTDETADVLDRRHQAARRAGR